MFWLFVVVEGMFSAAESLSGIMYGSHVDSFSKVSRESPNSLFHDQFSSDAPVLTFP